MIGELNATTHDAAHGTLSVRGVTFLKKFLTFTSWPAEASTRVLRGGRKLEMLVSRPHPDTHDSDSTYAPRAVFRHTQILRSRIHIVPGTVSTSAGSAGSAAAARSEDASKAAVSED